MRMISLMREPTMKFRKETTEGDMILSFLRNDVSLEGKHLMTRNAG
jgi:hypothetical protein